MPDPEPAETADDKVRCPHCRTARLRVLTKLDRIETLYGNSLMNRIRARRGDTIYHCVYCRLQFYDARKPRVAPVTEVNRPADTPDQKKSEPEADFAQRDQGCRADPA